MAVDHATGSVWRFDGDQYTWELDPIEKPVEVYIPSPIQNNNQNTNSNHNQNNVNVKIDATLLEKLKK